MDYDKDKVDEIVLALLFLTLHGGGRAWKGHDWDALGRLHEKGMIGDPVGKAKSVLLTEEAYPATSGDGLRDAKLTVEVPRSSEWPRLRRSLHRRPQVPELWLLVCVPGIHA
jgi:hypothetical protein